MIHFLYGTCPTFDCSVFKTSNIQNNNVDFNKIVPHPVLLQLQYTNKWCERYSAYHYATKGNWEQPLCIGAIGPTEGPSTVFIKAQWEISVFHDFGWFKLYLISIRYFGMQDSFSYYNDGYYVIESLLVVTLEKEYLRYSEIFF